MCCEFRLSVAPNDTDRLGAGYDGQVISSLDVCSAGDVQEAEGCGVFGVKGEKAGVIGDS